MQTKLMRVYIVLSFHYEILIVLEALVGCVVLPDPVARNGQN